MRTRFLLFDCIAYIVYDGMLRRFVKNACAQSKKNEYGHARHKHSARRLSRRWYVPQRTTVCCVCVCVRARARGSDFFFYFWKICEIRFFLIKIQIYSIGSTKVFFFFELWCIYVFLSADAYLFFLICSYICIPKMHDKQGRRKTAFCS